MRQLIIIADMEGASGIFESNREACYHEDIYTKKTLWRDFGRGCITSDVLAVCEAANNFGIDEIMLYDSHFAGCDEFNVMLDKLPRNVRVFDVPNRESHWRRIRGQALFNPFGIITVGQHARFGEPNAYFPHTVQTPPIKAFWVNELNIGEIGIGVLSFRGVPYIANIGCAASHKEALELSSKVGCVSVKDKLHKWEPSCIETNPLIREGVFSALKDYDKKTAAEMNGYCKCSMELDDKYHFDIPKHITWRGEFHKKAAYWEAPYFEIALELFEVVRGYICKDNC